MNRQQRRAGARRGQARAMQQNRDNPAYWSNYGLALHNRGRLERAVASYDRAIALRPDLAEAYANRGVALQALRQFAEAVANFDHAIALKPDSTEVYYNRGNALRHLDRLDAALRRSWQSANLPQRREPVGSA